MSSTAFSRKKCEQMLDRAFVLLDEEYIRNAIDRPLDRANRDATQEADLYETPKASALLRQVGRYVQVIYAQGLRAPREVPTDRAEAEAVRLLERFYQGASGQGYAAACLDALSQGEEGIAYLRTFLLDAVKQEEREKHTHWVFQSGIGSAAWETQRMIMTILLERLRDMLPPDLANARPERIVDYLPQLLLAYVAARAELRNLVLRT